MEEPNNKTGWRQAFAEVSKETAKNSAKAAGEAISGVVGTIKDGMSAAVTGSLMSTSGGRAAMALGGAAKGAAKGMYNFGKNIKDKRATPDSDKSEGDLTPFFEPTNEELEKQSDSLERIETLLEPDPRDDQKEAERMRELKRLADNAGSSKIKKVKSSDGKDGGIMDTMMGLFGAGGSLAGLGSVLLTVIAPLTAFGAAVALTTKWVSDEAAKAMNVTTANDKGQVFDNAEDSAIISLGNYAATKVEKDGNIEDNFYAKGLNEDRGAMGVVQSKTDLDMRMIEAKERIANSLETVADAEAELAAAKAQTTGLFTSQEDIDKDILEAKRKVVEVTQTMALQHEQRAKLEATSVKFSKEFNERMKDKDFAKLIQAATEKLVKDGTLDNAKILLGEDGKIKKAVATILNTDIVKQKIENARKLEVITPKKVDAAGREIGGIDQAVRVSKETVAAQTAEVNGGARDSMGNTIQKVDNNALGKKATEEFNKLSDKEKAKITNDSLSKNITALENSITTMDYNGMTAKEVTTTIEGIQNSIKSLESQKINASSKDLTPVDVTNTDDFGVPISTDFAGNELPYFRNADIKSYQLNKEAGFDVKFPDRNINGNSDNTKIAIDKLTIAVDKMGAGNNAIDASKKVNNSSVTNIGMSTTPLDTNPAAEF